MLRLVLLMLFILFCPIRTIAQPLLTLNRADSARLFRQLKSSERDFLYEFLAEIDANKGDTLGNKLKLKAAGTAFRSANKSKDKNMIAQTAYYVGKFSLEEGAVLEAKYYLEKALNYVDFSTHGVLACRIYLALSDVSSDLGDLKEAFQYSDDALNLSIKEGDSILTVSILNEIGDLYLSQKDFISARNAYERAQKVAETKQEEHSVASTLHRFGRFYYARNELNKALDYFQRSLNLCSREKEPLCHTENLLEIGKVFTAMGRHENALLKFLKVLYVYEKFDNPKALKLTLYETAQCYISLKKYDIANEYLIRANNIASENENKSLQINILYSLSQVNDSLRNYEQALRFYVKYSQTKDSVFSMEKMKAVAETEARFKNREKDNENALLRQEQAIKETTIENQRLIVVSILFLLFFSIGIIFFIFKAKEKSRFTNQLLNDQKRDIEIKNQLLQNQSDEIKKKNIELVLQNEAIFKQKEELANINDVKDKLFSIISHDFRSPLNSLQGALTILQMGLLSEQETKKIIGDLKFKLDLTLTLLDNLLNWAKSQMQGVEIHPQIFNVEEVVSDTVSLLQAQSERKEIVVIQNYFGDRAVYADIRTVELVVRNLLANAIKFTPNKGKITINTTSDEHELSISVADNGVGIPPNVLKNMFQENNSYTSLGTSQEKGTGLGLQLCKSYVEKNGGTIIVESEVGVGSKFSFSIPLNKQST